MFNEILKICVHLGIQLNNACFNTKVLTFGIAAEFPTLISLQTFITSASVNNVLSNRILSSCTLSMFPGPILGVHFSASSEPIEEKYSFMCSFKSIPSNIVSEFSFFKFSTVVFWDWGKSLFISCQNVCNFRQLQVISGRYAL